MSNTLRYAPASHGKTGSMSEIDRLRVENQRLSDEVKRLVTTESQLYEVQEHLDGQMSAYRQLYELGKKFNTTVDLTTILQLAAQFVLYELNFERCLFLLKQSGSNIFSIETMDGYYDDAESTSIARLVLPTASLALAPLYAGVERVLCLPDCRRSELTSLRRLPDLYRDQQRELLPSARMGAAVSRRESPRTYAGGLALAGGLARRAGSANPDRKACLARPAHRRHRPRNQEPA